MFFRIDFLFPLTTNKVDWKSWCIEGKHKWCNEQHKTFSGIKHSIHRRQIQFGWIIWLYYQGHVSHPWQGTFVFKKLLPSRMPIKLVQPPEQLTSFCQWSSKSCKNSECCNNYEYGACGHGWWGHAVLSSAAIDLTGGLCVPWNEKLGVDMSLGGGLPLFLGVGVKESIAGSTLVLLQPIWFPEHC